MVKHVSRGCQGTEQGGCDGGADKQEVVLKEWQALGLRVPRNCAGFYTRVMAHSGNMDCTGAVE